jgi:beta-galactosidase
VEEEHLDALSGLKVLFMPRMIVSDEYTEEAYAKFVKAGGTLVCESECGAFSPEGIYHYPEDRFTTRLSGVSEVGRRNINIDAVKATVNGQKLNLGLTQWLTPWQKRKGEVWADYTDGALISEVSVGKGRIVLCGTYLGDPYLKNWMPDFERFVELIVQRAGWKPEVEVVSPKPDKDSFVYVKHGVSFGKRIVFVFFPANKNEVHLKFKKGYFKSNRVTDIISNRKITIQDTETGQECRFEAPEWRFSVLVEK